MRAFAHQYLPGGIFIMALLGHSLGNWPSKSPTPFGLSHDVFMKQEFDPLAPFCMPEKEPCGFYDISLDGDGQLDWVKSWCQCPAKFECAYDGTDLRQRVYRFVCKRSTGKRILVRRKSGGGTRRRI